MNENIIESRRERMGSSGFPIRYDTNRPVQTQKQARSLKLLILDEELYYPCSRGENKGVD